MTTYRFWYHMVGLIKFQVNDNILIVCTSTFPLQACMKNQNRLILFLIVLD